MFSDPKFVWADNFLLDLKLFLDTNIFVGKIIWTKKLLDLYFLARATVGTSLYVLLCQSVS